MTKPLTHEDFPAFFQAVHGYEPFPWQRRLVKRLAEGRGWPRVLDLPTASGKTAALDAALFHLALCWNDPEQAAVRIVFVVDRRLVVDEAFRRARRLEATLRDADPRTDPVVAEVATRLARLSGDEELPLVASRLRGGAPLEHIWARSPTQPAVLCSTVDQVGSRLLFRGYGVSDRMRPIHAGLLGEGSLFLLDEAHLSEPFRQTLEAVGGIGRAGIRQVLLSATPGMADADAVRLASEDLETPVLRARVETGKPAMLRVVRSSRPEGEFADSALGILREIQVATGRERGIAIGVVVNRVALARKIHRILCERVPDGGAESVRLMIGRSRPVDRDSLAGDLKPFFTACDDRSSARSLIVVATQCLEVGVDIDLDGLVTQAAPLDALRQRFGRLDRAGRGHEKTNGVPRAAVLALAGEVRKRADDPIYGDRVRLTWEWMQSASPDGVIDFGVRAMDAALSSGGVRQAETVAVRSDAPVVMPAYLDAWARTAPVPAADPEVDLFLHGADRAPADVMVVWRDDMEQGDLRAANAKRLMELLSLVPPRAGEMLPVPMAAARRWLSRGHGTDDPPDSTSDVSERREDSPRLRGPTRRVFRWAGLESPRTEVVRGDEILPGDLLVVPAAYGGCDDHGWDPSRSEPVRDIADEASRDYAARHWAVRICPSRTGKERWSVAAAVLADREGHSAKDLASRLAEALAPTGLELPDAEGEKQTTLHETLERLRWLRQAKGNRIALRFPYANSGGEGCGGVVLLAPRGLQIPGDPVRAPSAPTTESDVFGYSFPGLVSLDDHGAHVEGVARKYARRLRKRPEVENDLALAAFLHDAGKADPRFQVMLSGAGVWNAPEGVVLAKSSRERVPGAWRAAGLPDDWRHEALSVRLAQAHPRFAEAHDPELVLWLVGTHHGLGRPFFGFREDSTPEPRAALGVDEWAFEADGAGPESPRFEFRGADWPEMFRRLRRRYGVWGLAELEAILRLADHRASEREETETA